MIAVAVASDRLMARYEENRAKLAKLADPRTSTWMPRSDTGSSPTSPVYYHRHHPLDRAGAPTALMELAYRLAVYESCVHSEHPRQRPHPITPIGEVDGRDRIVDLYTTARSTRTTRSECPLLGALRRPRQPPRRMGVTLKLTENVLNTYATRGAGAPRPARVVAYLYDNTIGDGSVQRVDLPAARQRWQQIAGITFRR